MTDEINWGPTGELVYGRTYSRTKPDGSRESWPETVERVVGGNLALVDDRYQLEGEREDLIRLITEFKLLPAGRHLWASGVKNAQHLFNCWVAGWTENPSDHFEFTFMRLMEGGGVGANYSNRYLENYPEISQQLSVEIVCDDEHPDYELMKSRGVLSTEYDSDWVDAFIIEDSREGWTSALVDLIETFYRLDDPHFYRVYDVSRVRAKGSKLKTFGGRASGPLPLAIMLDNVASVLCNSYGSPITGLDAMEIDHAIAQCVVSGGVRRSARMAMMHWADPQIGEFINIKQDTGSHWTTNISVEVDELFWKRLNGDFSDYPDIHPWDGEYQEDTTNMILDEVVTGMLLNGEPGFWDSSLSNTGEPNEVVCTNPCGEITLEPWEPCNLGHINLAAFVTEHGQVLTWELYKAHKLMTRFLIRATFSEVGDPKSAEVLARNRRIGVGHLGVASYLALTGRAYSEAPLDQEFRALLRSLAAAVDDAAEQYSHQLRIPVPVKRRTVAPTGTISKMPGVSEGIHPIFAKYFNRRIRFSMNDPDQRRQINELEIQGFHSEPDRSAADTWVVTIPTKDTLLEQVSEIYSEERAEEIVQSAADLTLNEMLSVQALYQMLWADNAVSFTANVHPAHYTANDVTSVLSRFGGILKGATIFPEMSFEQAPYERISKQQYEAASARDVGDGVDEECANGACPIR